MTADAAEAGGMSRARHPAGLLRPAATRTLRTADRTPLPAGPPVQNLLLRQADPERRRPVGHPAVFVVGADAGGRCRLQTLLVRFRLVVRPYGDGAAFLRSYAPSQPGCLIIVAGCAAADGLRVQRELRQRRLRLPVILLIQAADTPLVVEAMRNGAFDVLEQPPDEQRLLRVVRAACAHDLRVRRRHGEAEQVRCRYLTLTARERDVAELVAAGASSRVIAGLIRVSEETIEVYRSRVKNKLRARNSADLARMLWLTSALEAALAGAAGS